MTTTTGLFGVDEVVAALDAAVAEKPEGYIYPSPNCQYIKDGQPSCIVAVVMSKLDPDLLEQETVKINDTAEHLEGFTPLARRVLSLAQVYQDGRHKLQDGEVFSHTHGWRKPWSLAVEKAKEVLV